jgi:hypothetical protein
VSKRQFLIRTARESDIEAIANLEKTVFGPLGTGYYGEEHIQSWLQTFPQGLLVAELGGAVVGYISGQLIEFNCFDLSGLLDIDQATQGGLMISSHRPKGNALYGFTVCSVAHGAGSRLNQAYLELAQTLHKRYYVGHVRLAGFASYYNSMLLDDSVDLTGLKQDDIALWYALNTVRRVGGTVWPNVVDPGIECLPEPANPDSVLRMHLRLPGCGLVAVVPKCLRDPQGGNYCALMAIDLFDLVK